MAFGTTIKDFAAGVRRNVSMTVALVVTTSVSLLLASLGLMLWKQTQLIEEYSGSQLQVRISMCNQNAAVPSCGGSAASEADEQRVVDALEKNPLVSDVDKETAKEALDKGKALLSQGTEVQQQAIDILREQDFWDSYYVTLNDPKQDQAIVEQFTGMDGVAAVTSLRDRFGPLFSMLTALRWAALGAAAILIVAAVLQVSNTIRMTAYARRREIGIMRLVGASSWHIQVPFVLESLFAGLVAAGLSFAGIAAFTKFVVYDVARHRRPDLTMWVDWGDAIWVGIVGLIIAVAVAVIPTLLLTRRYLRV